jgi:CRP/FNR family transcriptional regulator, cyclic AMP receptor protein
MSDLTAEKMTKRFEGPDGLRLLREMFVRQPLTQNKPDVVDQLARFAAIEGYEIGQTIIEQDETDTDILFILAGSVVVSPNGRPDTTRTAGTHVGEMTAIDPAARRSATVTAKEPTVIARVSEPNFSSIANAHPFIWRHLAREMADRLRQRVEKVPSRKPKPRVFIASSAEGVATARAFKSALGDGDAEVKIWTDGIFTPGWTNIEALEAELVRADFALLLLSPDDKVISRAATADAPRDNIVLELGLFAGALGRRRALMALPEGITLKVPTDLLGVNPIKYNPTDIADATKELISVIRSLGSK